MRKKNTGALLLCLLLMTGCAKTPVTEPSDTPAETQTAAPSGNPVEQKEYQYHITSAEDWEIEQEEGGIILKNYKGEYAIIEIPAEFDGVPVTAVGDGCFNKNTLIGAVKLPDSVERIGAGAFYNCEQLEHVSLPERLTSIGQSAFAGCKHLEAIELPAGLKELGILSFNASGLKSIVIPDSIETIPDGAFMLCEGLVSVGLPKNCKSLGQQAFYQCRELENMTLPEGLEEVWNRCFAETPWYTEYCKEQGDGYIVFGDALYGCGANPGEELPRIRVIQPYAFQGVTNLENLVIPDSVESLNAYAFAECTGLRYVEIPDSVTEIGPWTFSGCKGLVEVKLPNHSAALNECMFSECYALKKVNIPESITEIPAGCFQSCYSLSDFTLPAGLTAIGENAFAVCLDIQELYLPASITTIGKNAFAYDTFTILNCEPSARPEDWDESWCGNEEEQSMGTIKWGVARE